MVINNVCCEHPKQDKGDTILTHHFIIGGIYFSVKTDCFIYKDKWAYKWQHILMKARFKLHCKTFGLNNFLCKYVFCN